MAKDRDIFYDGNVEEVDISLSFQDGDYSFNEAEINTLEALEEFSFEEILALNEMSEAEALALLYFNGDLGLPIIIEEESDAEVESLQAEED